MICHPYLLTPPTYFQGQHPQSPGSTPLGKCPPHNWFQLEERGYDSFDKSGPILIIYFTVKFRNDLRMKLELKLPPALKCIDARHCKM